MIRYRTFRNDDPPQIVDLWNQCFQGRGALQLPSPTFLEYFLFAKLTFTPQHLHVAYDDEENLSGFVLAGQGPNGSELAVSPNVGVICLLGAHPDFRGQGVGRTLLQKAEESLKAGGAEMIYAGAHAPFDPFSFGLYGGSQSPGFLDSDTDAVPFFQHHGYAVDKQSLVLQASLEEHSPVVDRRFPVLRRRYEVCLHMPMRGTFDWYQELSVGPVEMMELTVEDKTTGEIAARAYAWEMDLYSSFWNEHAVGLFDLQVMEPYRRQGIGKFLVSQMMEYFHEQFFTLIEVHVDAENQPAEKLFHSLGFHQVDRGQVLSKQLST